MKPLWWSVFVGNVCRPGAGSACCRYLVMRDDGFRCAKLTPLKATIDERVTKMNAQGDNCEGKPIEERI